MRSRQEILEDLYKAPQQFSQHMKNGAYTQAKLCHYYAVLIATFLELNQKEINKIFGDDGLFNPEEAKKAYVEADKRVKERNGIYK